MRKQQKRKPQRKQQKRSNAWGEKSLKVGGGAELE